jgi:hypothetical protein
MAIAKLSEELRKRITAYIIEYPKEKPADVAKYFEADLRAVYEVRQQLCKKGLLPRTYKRKPNKPKQQAEVRIPEQKPESPEVKEVEVLESAGQQAIVELILEMTKELELLRAQLSSCKSVIAYLEGKLEKRDGLAV